MLSFKVSRHVRMSKHSRFSALSTPNSNFQLFWSAVTCSRHELVLDLFHDNLLAMFCSFCGFQASENANFCSSFGKGELLNP